LKLNECASRGGTCGGFIDNGTYGSGDGITIQAVNFETGSLIAGSGGNHVYVQVEQTPPGKIERFDGNDDGEVVITSTAGLLSQVAKVTAAYKGASGLCNTGETDCFRVTTMADVDSRKVRVPLKRGKAVDCNYQKLKSGAISQSTSSAKLVEDLKAMSSRTRSGVVSPCWGCLTKAMLRLT
jgi:hypothetical protein